MVQKYRKATLRIILPKNMLLSKSIIKDRAVRILILERTINR